MCDGAQMAIFGDFLCPVFAASREQQHISDLHSKFALGHAMCRSMVDIQSVAAEILGEERIERQKKETTGQKMACPVR